MEDFEVDQAIDVVSLGESVNFSGLVLQGSPIDAVCNSRVESQRPARHDVHVIGLGFQLQIPRL